MKNLRLKLMCVIVLLFIISISTMVYAYAETEQVTTYEVLEPTYFLINGADYVRENMLSTTLYVSADEIYFSGTSAEGGPWIVKTNAQGEVLSQIKLHVDNGEKIGICGMSKVPAGLLLGIIDFKTSLGSIGLLKNDGQVSYTDLGDARYFSYFPIENGILAQGTLYDKINQTLAPQTILIDQDGHIIFKRTGVAYDIETDRGLLGTSVCCALNDSIFVVESRGSSIGGFGGFKGPSELFCLNLFGQEKWNIPLDPNIVVENIRATDDKVYMFGFLGKWDEEGIILEKQAVVQCYSQNGEYQWSQQFSSPEEYHFGDAGLGITVAASMKNDVWYISVIGTDGAIRKMVKIDAPAQYINRPYIISDKMLVLLGMTNKQLVICNVPIG